MDDYAPYSYKKPENFETHINKNLIFINGYKHYVTQNEFITWVSKNSWEILLSEFSQSEKIIPCTWKIICNTCEQMNVSGNILNAGENVEDQEDYGFTASFFKTTPIIIYNTTKNKLMKMKIIPMLNNDEQQLNYQQCKYICKIEKDKEDNLKS